MHDRDQHYGYDADFRVHIFVELKAYTHMHEALPHKCSYIIIVVSPCSMLPAAQAAETCQ